MIQRKLPTKSLFKTFFLAALLIPVVLFATACDGKSAEKRHKFSDNRIETQLEIKLRHTFADYAQTTFKESFVQRYYGTFESGVSVAMMSSTDFEYTQALWEESVGGILFRMSDGNAIIVWHNNAFMGLQEAFDNELLTVDNLIAVANLQNFGTTETIDISNYSPKQSSLGNINFVDYTAHYFNSIKIKDGFLRLGSLRDNNGNFTRDERGGFQLNIISKFDFNGNNYGINQVLQVVMSM